MTSKAYPYATVAVKHEVHWKLEKWRQALCDRWGRRVTMSETVDWLLDTAGAPDDQVQAINQHLRRQVRQEYESETTVA